MGSPWLDEKVDALIRYLTPGKRVRRALVVADPTSAATVARAVRRAIDAAFHTVDLSEVPDPVARLAEVIAQPSDPAGTRWFVLPAASEQLDQVVGYLNLHRERFDIGAGTAAFVVGPAAFDVWLRGAPDFHRYVQRFDFVDLFAVWQDAMQAQDTVEAKSNLEAVRLEQDRVERLRRDGPSSDLFGALLALAKRQEQIGRLDKAMRSLDEADAVRGELQHALRRGDVVAGPEFLRWSEWSTYAVGLQRSEVLDGQAEDAEALREVRRLQLPHDCSEQDRVNHAFGVAFVESSILTSVEAALRWEAVSTATGWGASPTRPSAETVAIAWCNAAGWWLDAARPGDAARCLDEAERAIGGEEDVESANRARLAVWQKGAPIALQRGALVEAIRLAAAALVLGRATANDHSVREATTFVAEALLLSARLVAAREQVAALGRSANPSGSPRLDLLGSVDTVLLEAQLDLGDQSGAKATLDRLTRNPARRRRYAQGGTDACHGAVRELTGETQRAERSYRSAIAHADDAEARLAATGARIALARVLRCRGALQEAGDLVAAALDVATPAGLRILEVRARTEVAWQRLAQGEPEGARLAAEAALATIADCGNHIDEPDALAAHAAALRRLGADGADAEDARWRRLVDAIGAAGLRARIERNLASVG